MRIKIVDMGGYVDRCRPYKVQMACGHLETRMMREDTAGEPWTEEAILQAPGANCEACGQLKYFKKPGFVTRYPDQQCVVACLALNAPAGEWKQCHPDVLAGLTLLYRAAGVEYWGYV